jgi:hypothetical protein
MRFIVKKQADSARRMFLTIIDAELKGRKLEEGKKMIDLTHRHYAGDEKNWEEIEKDIEKAYSIHFIGNESVKKGIKNKEKTASIQGVKHAMIIKG